MVKVDTFDGNKLQPTATETFADIHKNLDRYKCVFRSDKQQGDYAFALDENLLSQHLMFLGGIGTGKTNAICQAIQQFQKNLSSQDVMIIFDAKGDYYNEFYREGKDIVVSNDDKSIGINGKKDYWNIFNEIERDDHMEENILEISKTLFSEKIAKTQQPFFPTAAKDLFSALLFHCCRKSDVTYNNFDLRRYWESATTDMILDLISLHPDLRAMENYIGDGTTGQALGVLAELQGTMREIFIGNFKKEGNLSIRQLVRQKGGRIIFIEYDIGVGEVLIPIYKLLFDLAIKEALSRTKSEGNVHFIADEFKLLPHLQHVDDAVNFGRSLGVKFLIGIQNVEQIYDAYSDGKSGGNSRAKSLLSGFSTSISFRVNDKESREFIQGLHGKSRKKEFVMSTIPGKGISEQIRDANVVEDWDVSRLKLGQAIVGLPGAEPFLFQFDRYNPKQ